MLETDIIKTVVSLDRDTTLCISISAHPSNFGMIVHNSAYKTLGLNFVYKAFAITDLAGVITGVRALGIRGCSVSMPFKEKVITYLDKVDQIASRIGAVNTIVNEKGILTGYNTDVYGAKKALEDIEGLAFKKVMLLGAGGVAKAILEALRSLKVKDVVIVNRTLQKAKELAKKMGYGSEPWQVRSQIEADVIINATPIGMEPDINQLPIDEQSIIQASVVMDAVVNPTESLFIRVAKQMGKLVIPGYKMSLFQAAMQFKLYTGFEAPLDVMEEAMLNFLQKTNNYA